MAKNGAKGGHSTPRFADPGRRPWWWRWPLRRSDWHRVRGNDQ